MSGPNDTPRVAVMRCNVPSCDRAGSYRGWRCPRHGSERTFPTGARPVAAPASAPRRGDGSRHEEVLYAALNREWWEAKPGGFPSSPRFMEAIWLRQYPWGAFLSPPRRFQADAAFPMQLVLVEIEGTAHKIGHQRAHDVKRRRLAEEAGWRVVSVLPDEVHDGTALAAIRRALDATAREGRG